MRYTFSEASLENCHKEIYYFERDIVEFREGLADIGMIDVIQGYVDGIKGVVDAAQGLELSEDAYYDMYIDLAEMDIAIDYQRGKQDGMKFALSTLGETSLDRWARI